MTTTSGLSSRASFTALRPLAASAMVSMPGCFFKQAAEPFAHQAVVVSKDDFNAGGIHVVFSRKHLALKFSYSTRGILMFLKELLSLTYVL